MSDAEFSPAALEQRLTEHFSAALELAIGETIFRGQIPARTVEGMAVLLGADLRDNTPSLRQYEVQLLGRYLNRDNAMDMVNRTWGILPFRSPDLIILRMGGTAVYPTNAAGRDVWGISLNLRVAAR